MCTKDDLVLVKTPSPAAVPVAMEVDLATPSSVSGSNCSTEAIRLQAVQDELARKDTSHQIAEAPWPYIKLQS